MPRGLPRKAEVLREKRQERKRLEMNLESKYADAIKRFLDAIGYKKWRRKVTEVVADVPKSGLGQDGICTQLGTTNFRTLADSIGYLDCLPEPAPEVQQHSVIKRCNVCGRSLEYFTDRGECITVTALELSVDIPDDLELAAAILAPYEPKKYRVCYPCYLKSFGVLTPIEALSQRFFGPRPGQEAAGE